MSPLPGALPGRTHRVARVPVEAGAVSIAMQCFVVAGAEVDRYRAVALPLGRHAIDGEQRTALRCRDLARVELVARIECRLHGHENRVEGTEEARRELRPHAFAVLAPEEPP